MSTPLKVHLDNFDLGRLTSVYRKDPSGLVLPTTLARKGTEFLISPTTYQEALNSAKGPAGVRYTAPFLRIFDLLGVKPHQAPHNVIAAELHPYVLEHNWGASEFEKLHLSREIAAFLAREMPAKVAWNVPNVATLIGKALRLSNAEAANLASLLDELFQLRLAEAGRTAEPVNEKEALCQAATDIGSVFDISSTHFEAAILGFNPESSAQRLLGSLAFRLRVASKPIPTKRSLAKGEARFRDIINGMLLGWGYTFAHPITPQEITEALPSLRCYSAYWTTRNPRDDISVNNMCDAIQLLYLPHVDLFSVDTRVYRDVARAIPEKLRTRLHPNGAFWREAAAKMETFDGLDTLLATYKNGGKVLLPLRS